MSTTPTLGPSLLQHLGRKIHELSDDKVAIIAGLLDRGGHDPHALEGRMILRDRLRVLRPPRRMSPCRLFCVPFEMLLSDPDAAHDPLRPISRGAILPIWEHVEPRLSALVRAAVVDAAATAASIDDDDLRVAGASLWQEGSRIIAESFDALAGDAVDAQWLRSMGAAFDAHASILGLRALLRDHDSGAPDAALAARIVALIQNAVRLGEGPAYASTVTAALHFKSPALVLGVLRRAGVGMRPGGGQPMILRFCDAMLRDLDRELASLHAADEALPQLVEGFESVADGISELTAVAVRTKDPALQGRIVRVHGKARRLVLDVLLPRLQPAMHGRAAAEDPDLAFERGSDCARRFADLLGIGKEISAFERKFASNRLTGPRSRAAP